MSSQMYKGSYKNKNHWGVTVCLRKTKKKGGKSSGRENRQVTHEELARD